MQAHRLRVGANRHGPHANLVPAIAAVSNLGLRFLGTGVDCDDLVANFPAVVVLEPRIVGSQRAVRIEDERQVIDELLGLPLVEEQVVLLKRGEHLLAQRRSLFASGLVFDVFGWHHNADVAAVVAHTKVEVLKELSCGSLPIELDSLFGHAPQQRRLIGKLGRLRILGDVEHPVVELIKHRRAVDRHLKPSSCGRPR